MLTKLYPMVQIEKGIWEIDEFDCASIFLIIGSEKAMVLDTGMGIGDLRGAIEMITDKPLQCVISHGHIDHTGNCRQFEEIWIHPDDQEAPVPQSLERRRYDTERIARRQKSCIGAPYTMFNLYPYDINVDLREPGPDDKMPVIHDLYDGEQFDLGGGRVITAYECPGHSKGEMIFIDDYDRICFCGDALNFNLGVGQVPLERTLKYMKRMRDMSDRYDRIYNGHHDFRALGMPLDDDCLPTVIDMMEDAVAGHIVPVETPSFWGQDVPLTRSGENLSHQEAAPAAYPGEKPKSRRITLRRGRCFLGIVPDNIWEHPEEHEDA